MMLFPSALVKWYISSQYMNLRGGLLKIYMLGGEKNIFFKWDIYIRKREAGSVSFETAFSDERK